MVLPPYNGKVVRTGTVSWDVTVSKDGWGILEMFPVSLLRGPGGLTYVFIITHKLPTLVPIDSPTLFVQRVFILAFYWYVLDGSVSIEMGLDPISFEYVFDTSSSHWVYDMTMCSLVYLSLVVSLPSGSLLLLSLLTPLCSPWMFSSLLSPWLLLVKLLYILSKAHLLAFGKGLPEVLYSWFKSSGLVQTILALWVRVLVTLYLATWRWWLSNWKYWCVFLGFL